MPTLLAGLDSIDLKRPGIAHYQVRFHLGGAGRYSLVPLNVIYGTLGLNPHDSVVFGGTHGNQREGQVVPPIHVPIACGEQEVTGCSFQQLIERSATEVLQPDLTYCGGFTIARKIVHMAERANRLVVPHSWASDGLTSASFHLTVFQRRAEFVEFNIS